jgi:hypothetical protein
MAQLCRKPLSAFSREWKWLGQTQVPIKPTRVAKSPPADMVRIPGGTFEFVVSGIMVEGSDAVGVDVQFP